MFLQGEFLAIRSAALPCFTTNAAAPVWLLLLLTPLLTAQLTTGIVEGVIRDAQHQPVSGASVLVEGTSGLRTALHTDPKGYFTVALPYGEYKINSELVKVTPLSSTYIELIQSGPQGIWVDDTKAATYPEGFSLAAILQDREPSTVAQSLNFTGLADQLLSVISQGGVSWTETRFTLEGLNATDSWQPGQPEILPNIADMGAITVRTGEVGFFMAQPEGAWHASLSSTDTGAPLAASNLPAVNAGVLLQDQYYRWLTRDGLEIGGPVDRRADVFASAWGQWGDQTVPLQPAGTLGSDQRSRLLFANVRGRVILTAHDQFDALYLGSRIDLSNWGTPDALEALTGNRMMPTFPLPGGFPGQEEVDHLDFVQTGWSHLSDGNSRVGTLQVRYGYSTAHQDSDLAGQGPLQEQSRIELTTGAISGAPPLGNFAIRTRQSLQISWQPRIFSFAKLHHRIAAGGGFESSNPRNRFNVPSNMDLTTANGMPAFVVDFNTPADSSTSIHSLSGYIDDTMTLDNQIMIDLGLAAERSTGSVEGTGGTLIAWNSVSPRVAIAWNLLHRITLRGGWSRHESPLAGRYLDYGNPNALSGEEYRWNDTNGNGWFDPGERGNLIMRFGGAYSSIARDLRQPYANRIDAALTVRLLPEVSAGINLFRVDGRQRIAPIDTGVPAQDYSPVTIDDPGPDGISGTYDDRPLTVYAQNPATLGQDRYLLTNPPGLNTRNLGFTSEAALRWHSLAVNASFTAEKSYAATNPGDTVYANDPGVAGSLLLDPNSSINAANRIFVDRAYVGKIYGTYKFPWLGIELASTAVYMDGLVFGRELLVTGLPQGPFMVDATARGSPEGGNRAEHIVNWNLGPRRSFHTRAGLLTLKMDLMNAMNAGSKVQESNLSGTDFNLRLPVAIQAPRSLNCGFNLTF
jgi:hypothetical protein